MLVDSHCHLDFPDFANELDAVVARAEAAGIGPLVTISTRVRKHADVLAIAERFPNVYCSVGTHPHNAHEELDISTEDLVARARDKVVRRDLEFLVRIVRMRAYRAVHIGETLGDRQHIRMPAHAR